MDVISQLVAQDLRRYLEEEGHVFQGENTLCPFHKDTKPSLHVSKKGDGWVWYCHSCGIGGNIIHFEMRKRDCSKSDAIRHLAERFHLDNGRPAQRRAVRQHLYHDAEGQVVYRKVKFSDDTWEFQHQEAGKWVGKKGDHPHVLFRWPAVKDSPDLFLVEGEKDAETLARLNYPATSADCGKKDQLKDVLPFFRGKNVRVCYDVGNDIEAEAAAAKIATVAANVFILKVPMPNVEDDITDYLDQFPTDDEKRDAMMTLLAAEKRYSPLAPRLAPFIKGRDVKLLDLRVEEVVEKLVFEAAINILHGKGGAGKTWLGFQIGRAVSLGIPIFGLKTKRMPVYYADFESPAPVLVDRVKVLDIDEVMFKHAAITSPPPKLDSPGWEEYKALEPGLLFIDSFRSAFDGDENSTEDVAPIMGRLKAIRDLGKTIIVVHHNTKDGKRYRGSTAIIDLADNVLDFHRCKKGNPNEEDENEVGGFDPIAIYSLGTGEKTRFAPWKVLLNFDPLDGGYTTAIDEDADIIDAIAEHLAESGCDPNQSQIIKWAKDTGVGPKKKELFTNLLKRGERESRWYSRREGNKRIYTLGLDPRRS